MSAAHIAERRVEVTAGKPGGYVIGLDLGQAQDYSALCVAQVFHCKRQTWERARFEPSAALAREVPARRFAIVSLHRYPLGTEYRAITRSVAGIVDQLTTAGGRPSLYVDASGCGRPVVENMRAAGLRLTGVVIGPGEKVGGDGKFLTVPKKVLASVMDSAFDDERLRITEESVFSEVMRKELQNFRVKKTAAGNDKLEAHRSGDHDDLVLACALAVFGGQRGRPQPPRGDDRFNIFRGL